METNGNNYPSSTNEDKLQYSLLPNTSPSDFIDIARSHQTSHASPIAWEASASSPPRPPGRMGMPRTPPSPQAKKIRLSFVSNSYDDGVPDWSESTITLARPPSPIQVQCPLLLSDNVIFGSRFGNTFPLFMARPQTIIDRGALVVEIFNNGLVC